MAVCMADATLGGVDVSGAALSVAQAMPNRVMTILSKRNAFMLLAEAST